MEYYISADTYNHIPRNFFGFKKRREPIQVKPFTLSAMSQNGDLFRMRYDKVRPKDDPEVSNTFFISESFGDKESEEEIALQLRLWILRTKDFNSGIDFICDTYQTEEVIRGIVEKYFRDFAVEYKISFVPGNVDVDSILDTYFPDEYFSGPAKKHMECFIYKQEGEEYTTDQKREMIATHERYPRREKYVLSDSRCHWMYSVRSFLFYEMKNFKKDKEASKKAVI